MSDVFIVKGGKKLSGEISVRGSKNAASKMMIASLLTRESCRLENMPLSLEIDITKELCERIGSAITIEDHACTITTSEISTSSVPELSRRNRIPILALGPLLHRTGVAEVPVVGGCYLGHRPINFHVEALAKMGVRVERRENSYYAEAHKIHGAEILLPYPSVGATENIILTAVLASGDTIITNAAIEPEIVNLIEMLVGMGARITINAEKRTVGIEGVRHLQGGTFRVMPDRNEIISFATAGLATRGEVFIRDVSRLPIEAFLKKLNEVGATYQEEAEGMRFYSPAHLKPVFVETAPHPGFMTDWQQPFCVLLTQVQGVSIIHETVYEDRFSYTKDLKRMGAHIEVVDECPGGHSCRFSGQAYHHSARIEGPVKLSGTDIVMTDIRAGMAHLIAALVAQGESRVSGIVHVDRGYEKIDERLRALGADITRV